jgi:hypothetical protein
LVRRAICGSVIGFEHRASGFILAMRRSADGFREVRFFHLLKAEWSLNFKLAEFENCYFFATRVLCVIRAINSNWRISLYIIQQFVCAVETLCLCLLETEFVFNLHELYA